YFLIQSILCACPCVPGNAHGRARFSSRRYVMNPSSWFGAVAKRGSMTGSEPTDGSRQGSDEFPRYVSDSRITGVRYFTAIRAASTAMSKHDDGVWVARTGRGDSPWRP